MAALLKVSENRIVNMDLIVDIMYHESVPEEGIASQLELAPVDSNAPCDEDEAGSIILEGADADRVWKFLADTAHIPDVHNLATDDSTPMPAGNKFADALQQHPK